MQSDYSSNLLIPSMEQDTVVLKKLDYLVKKVKYLEAKVVNLENVSPVPKNMEARISDLEIFRERASKNRKDRLLESKKYVDIDAVKQISAQVAENTIGQLARGIIHNCVEEQSKAFTAWQYAQQQQIFQRLHQLEQENAQLKEKNEILSDKYLFLENKLAGITDSQEAAFLMRMTRYREELQSTIDAVCKTVNEQLASNLMLVYADKLDEFISDQLKTLNGFEIRQQVCDEDIIKIRSQLNLLETGQDHRYESMHLYFDQKFKDIASVQMSWESKLEASGQEISGIVASERASAQEHFEHIQKSISEIIENGSRSNELVEGHLASLAYSIRTHDDKIRNQSEKIHRSLELVKKIRSKVREIEINVSDLSRSGHSLDNLLHDFDGRGNNSLLESPHFNNIIERVVNLEENFASLETFPGQCAPFSSTLLIERKNVESIVENQDAKFPSVVNADGMDILFPEGALITGISNNGGSSSLATSRDNISITPNSDVFAIDSTGDHEDSVNVESVPHSETTCIVPPSYNKDKELRQKTVVSDLTEELASNRSTLSLSGIILTKKVEHRKAFIQRLSQADLL